MGTPRRPPELSCCRAAPTSRRGAQEPLATQSASREGFKQPRMRACEAQTGGVSRETHRARARPSRRHSRCPSGVRAARRDTRHTRTRATARRFSSSAVTHPRHAIAAGTQALEPQGSRPCGDAGTRHPTGPDSPCVARHPSPSRPLSRMPLIVTATSPSSSFGCRSIALAHGADTHRPPAQGTSSRHGGHTSKAGPGRPGDTRAASGRSRDRPWGPDVRSRVRPPSVAAPGPRGTTRFVTTPANRTPPVRAVSRTSDLPLSDATRPRRTRRALVTGRRFTAAGAAEATSAPLQSRANRSASRRPTRPPIREAETERPGARVRASASSHWSLPPA